MNYRNACLSTSNIVNTNKINPKNSNPTTKTTTHLGKRVVQILERRWTAYKENYIALYGEDTYNYMYLTPNYWVMPEDEEEEEEEIYYSSGEYE